MSKRYDAIVIGTGQAGPSLAARLAGAGLRVAVAERKRFGGTCVNNGCIPTKALVASAYAAFLARHAADNGIALAGGVSVDMKRVKARKDEIVAANLLDGESRSIQERIPIYGLFVDPPLGRVGMTEAEVRATGRPALVGMRPMTKVGRAMEKGETRGFMKVVVDAETRRILGAAILGVGGDEAIHCIADVMYAKAPAGVLQRAVHIHPTVAELIPTVLGELKPLA